MKSFIALYRGQTIGSASLVAVSADPEIVSKVSEWLSEGLPDREVVDPVLEAIEHGKKEALNVIQEEAMDEMGNVIHIEQKKPSKPA